MSKGGHWTDRGPNEHPVRLGDPQGREWNGPRHWPPRTATTHFLTRKDGNGMEHGHIHRFYVDAH